MDKICVIGLGRIGLPLALLLAKANYRVTGFDINKDLLLNISENKLNPKTFEEEKKYIDEFYGKSFFVQHKLQDAIQTTDAVFIAIGTGVSPDGTPDLSSLYNLIDDICRYPEKVRGKLFVFKSTLPVGTTRKIASIIDQKTNTKCGKDTFVAFCPERVLGNKAIQEMEFLPKIIGGMDKISSEKAAQIYSKIGGKIIVVENPEAAEMIKLIDNSYRQTLFAFSNDVSLLAQHLGLNAYELIKNANDSYTRNNIPFPSAGVSGYCLTKDPRYLEYVFKEISSLRGFSSVWYYARKTNDYMPLYLVNLIKDTYMSIGKSIKKRNILVCGITYKENIDDIRCSHGLEIVNQLKKLGAHVLIWDPIVQDKVNNAKIIKNPWEILNILDGLIFTVKHEEFVKLLEKDLIIQMAKKMRIPLIADGWGIFQKLIGNKDIIYIGVGIPK